VAAGPPWPGPGQNRRRRRHRPRPLCPAGSTCLPPSSSRRTPQPPIHRRRPSTRPRRLAARRGSPWPPPCASPASCTSPAPRLPVAPPLPPLPCRTKKTTRRGRRRTGRAASAAGARLPLHPRPHHWAGSPRPHTCNRQEPSVRPPPQQAPRPRRDRSIDRSTNQSALRSISNLVGPIRRRRWNRCWLRLE
jgi:hypothetical protein